MPDLISEQGLLFEGPGRLAVVDDLRLDPPGPGEVAVRMVASGVCRSDLHVVDGDWERPTGIVLGHEGAAVVEALGPDVVERGPEDAVDSGGIRVGDLVVLAWTAPCGTCPACMRGEPWLCATPRGGGHRLASPDVRLRRADGSAVGAYSGIGTFATQQVVVVEAAIPVDPRTPPTSAALIGCAATTGIGAVRNTAGVQSGESVVILGLGGVGLAALMAAVTRGADPVIGVDPDAAKRDLALSLGASAAIIPDALDPMAARFPSGGPDHVLECIGLTATVGSAVRIVRPGGTVTLVGMPAMGASAGIDVYRFVEDGKRLLGSNYGSCVPARDFPAIAREVVESRLPLDRLVTETIALAAVPVALERMRRGEGLRRVVTFDP